MATQFSGILPGLQASTFDFVVAPTTITEERAENYLFSEGHLNTDFQFVVRNDGSEVTDVKGFGGKVIAVNKGWPTIVERVGLQMTSDGPLKATEQTQMLWLFVRLVSRFGQKIFT